MGNDHLIFEFPLGCQSQWQCLAYLLVELSAHGDRVFQLEEGGDYLPAVRISVRKIESGLTLFASVGLGLDESRLLVDPLHASIASG